MLWHGAASRSGHARPPMATDRDSPGVIIPPPLIFAVFFCLGLAIDALIPLRSWGGPIAQGIGGALIAVGVVTGLVVVLQFRRAKTHIEPWEPASTLVTRGIYRLSRNPVYVPLALCHAGLALVLGKTWTLTMVLPALVFIRFGVIGREERYLERRFGETYRTYCRTVRRWL